MVDCSVGILSQGILISIVIVMEVEQIKVFVPRTDTLYHVLIICF